MYIEVLVCFSPFIRKGLSFARGGGKTHWGLSAPQAVTLVWPLEGFESQNRNDPATDGSSVESEKEKEKETHTMVVTSRPKKNQLATTRPQHGGSRIHLVTFSHSGLNPFCTAALRPHFRDARVSRRPPPSGPGADVRLEPVPPLSQLDHDKAGGLEDSYLGADARGPG